MKATDLSDATEYSVNDVTRVFGSWQNGLDAAEVDNTARLIDDLHRVADELGHRPTTTDMNDHGHVSATTYAKYFGTYTAAIEQAFEGTATSRSTDGTDTTDQAEGRETDTGTSATADTAAGDRNAAGTEQVNSGDDDGILGDIMGDFDDLSDSEAE